MELSLPIVAATYWLEAADRFAKILETQTNVMHACEARPYDDGVAQLV